MMGQRILLADHEGRKTPGLLPASLAFVVALAGCSQPEESFEPPSSAPTVRGAVLESGSSFWRSTLTDKRRPCCIERIGEYGLPEWVCRPAPWTEIATEAARERYCTPDLGSAGESEVDFNPWTTGIDVDSWESDSLANVSARVDDVPEPGDAFCADVELLCRLDTYAATDDTLPPFCDHYCTAIGLQCQADAAKDASLLLAGPPCPDDDETCVADQRGPTVESATAALLDAIVKHYYAAALFIYAWNHASGEACAQLQVDQRLANGVGLVIEEPMEALYASKIAHSVDQIEDVITDAVQRLLARGDAGTGLRTAEGLVSEWYAPDSPRSLALQFILGGGVRLFPCTIDPETPGVPGGTALFERGGAAIQTDGPLLPFAQGLGLTDVPPPDAPTRCCLNGDCGGDVATCGDVIFEHYETTTGAWDDALFSLVAAADRLCCEDVCEGSDTYCLDDDVNPRLASAYRFCCSDVCERPADSCRDVVLDAYETHPEGWELALLGRAEYLKTLHTSSDPAFPRRNPEDLGLGGPLAPSASRKPLELWRADGGAPSDTTAVYSTVHGAFRLGPADVAHPPEWCMANAFAVPFGQTGEAPIDAFVGADRLLGALLAAWEASPQAGDPNWSMVTEALERSQGDTIARLDVSGSGKSIGEFDAIDLDSWITIEIPDLNTLATQLGYDDAEAARPNLRLFPRGARPAGTDAQDLLSGNSCLDDTASLSPLSCRIPFLDVVGSEAVISDYVGGVGDLDEATWGRSTAGFDDGSGRTRKGIFVLWLGETPIAWFNIPSLGAATFVTDSDVVSTTGSTTPGTTLFWFDSTTVPITTGGRLIDLAQEIIARDPADCRLPRRNVFGLAADYVPPLENEVLLGPPPQESAYVRYLDIARRAAEDAAAAMTAAAEAEHRVMTDEALYRTEVETAFADADAEIEQICGPAALQSGTTAASVRNACHVPTSVLGSGEAAQTDLRGPWLATLAQDFTSEDSDPALPFANPYLSSSNIRDAETCSTALAGAAENEDFSGLIARLKISSTCSAFAAMREATERLESEDYALPDVLETGELDATVVWEGDVRESLSDIEQSLATIETKFSVLSEELEQLHIELDNLEMIKHHQEQWDWVDVVTPILSTLDAVVSCVASAVGSQSISSANLTSSFFNEQGQGTGCLAIVWEIETWVDFGLEESSENDETSLMVKRAALAISSFSAYLVQSVAEVNDAIDEIRSALIELRSLEELAVATASRADRGQQRAKIESIWADPWQRAFLSSQKRHAIASMRRAQRLGFIARRAVEFRFVVDLERMSQPTLLGDVPAEWARDVFLDQFAIDDPLDRFAQPTIDYVTHLDDFVRFYGSSFPFQNGTSTAVISAKGDLGSAFFECCFEGIDCEGDDRVNGWMKRPCTDETGEQITARMDGGTVVVDHPPLEVHRKVDTDGVLLRGRFRKHCAGEPDHVTHDRTTDCSAAPINSAIDYYSWRFWVSLEALEEGGRLASLGMSAANYNYRIRELALNLVGDDLRDCAQTANPASCYSTSVVPYDLIQTGTVRIRDHGLVPREYALPRGGVLGGKALAAELTLSSPIASGDQTLLSQCWAQEFAGRPLQGEYELRIYQTEALQWDELEDVQIVVVLDYWSPFEVVP